MAQLEILFITHKNPPATGGMEKQSVELITGLKPFVTAHSIVYDERVSRLRFFMSLNRRIRKTIQENPGISIVHFNDALIASVSLLGSWKHSLKRVVTVHGLDVVFPLFIYQRFILPMFNRFDLIVAVSSATAAACEKRGLERDKVVVINNGVDPQIHSNATRHQVERLLSEKYGANAKGKKILVAMGRPVKRKGFSWFIKNVFSKLDPGFVLLLIGPIKKQNSRQSLFSTFIPAFFKHIIQLLLGYPSDEIELEKLVKDPSHQNVFRLGKIPLQEVIDILSCADAFIMPNIEVSGDMEGFGLVCLEACMCGANVFAAASGGITDAIIDGKNGHLLPPGDAASWINAINNMKSDQKLLDQKAIIEFTAANFSWQKMCAAYLEHFLKL